MKSRLIAAIVLVTLACSSVPLIFASAMPMHVRTPEKPAHSCCPGLHPRVELLFVIPADMPPCGGRMPCCAKSSPQSQQSLPAAKSTGPKGLAAQDAEGSTFSLGRAPGFAFAATRTDSPPYSTLSTVLRI